MLEVPTTLKVLREKLLCSQHLSQSSDHTWRQSRTPALVNIDRRQGWDFAAQVSNVLSREHSFVTGPPVGRHSTVKFLATADLEHDVCIVERKC